MSTNAPATADIELIGFVSLENRRPVTEKPQTFIYDALFNYGDPTQVGIGSFRHFVGHDVHQKKDHCYEIVAKVCIDQNTQ